MASGFGPGFWETVKSPPEMPGLSRPVWLTIAASVPTALGWYGYYKFSVEEELFYDELRREGRTSGFGGYVRLLLLLCCCYCCRCYYCGRSVPTVCTRPPRPRTTSRPSNAVLPGTAP